MAAKKRSRKKIDLRDLPSLGIGVPPSTDVTLDSDTILEEQLSSSVQEPDKTAESLPTDSGDVQASPSSQSTQPDETAKSLPTDSIQAEAPRKEVPKPESRYIDKRPQRPAVKPIQLLNSATNDLGEVLNSGDKIWVKAPWGKRAIAEIVEFYQDEEGTAWARYTSNQTPPPGWTWLGGCARAQCLIKAGAE